MADNQVSKDIKAAAEERIVSVEMVDSKISCEFCITAGTWNDANYKVTEYDKIFDNWQDFNDYADVFFKNTVKA